jgi:hypothetical protein
LLDGTGTIKLGKGILTSSEYNKSFQWIPDSVFPVALRDLTDDDDGYLLSWNKNNNHIISSGKTVKDIQDEIDSDCAALETKIIGGSTNLTIKQLEDTIKGNQSSVCLDDLETKI